MWPYSKLKGIKPEIREAQCPVCKGQSSGEQFPVGTIFTAACVLCQDPEHFKTKNGNYQIEQRGQ